MKNQNTLAQRIKRSLVARWAREDYPGADPRFQIALFSKDVAVFAFSPISAVLLYSVLTSPKTMTKRSIQTEVAHEAPSMEGNKSQIIEFRGTGKSPLQSGFSRRTPGALVRVKLLNVVETYTTAPVHAQVVDAGLGANLLGGTLIGDATPDTNFERITITFRYVRDPQREGMALPLSARALGLDGTYGLIASKKEGFLTRSALGSAGATSQDLQGKLGGASDFSQILIKALTAGLVQEFGSGAQVEKNRSQVLTLQPSTVFFAELTDFFPGGQK